MRTPAGIPAYVSRERGSAELDISIDTWDAMVKAERLPRPVFIGINGTTPRWRWADVDATLSAQTENGDAEPEPFFRRHPREQAKEHRRGTA